MNSPARRWVGRALVVAGAFLGLVLLLCRLAQPDGVLQPWHADALGPDFRARDARPGFTFEQYRQREDRLFAALPAVFTTDTVTGNAQAPLRRYAVGGLGNPATYDRNWNRTYEFRPAGRPRGGALLVHGLTDSPYSLRRVGEILADEGFYVLALRLPGHGTLPGALVNVHYRDWAAAVRLGLDHVRTQMSGSGNLFLLGYSTGAALALDAALHDSSVDRLILFSPAIGVSRLGRIAGWFHGIRWLPGFRRNAWSELGLEYDPFKYNSFAMNGGAQTYHLARRVRRALRAHPALPPVLTFQSLADATVFTHSVVYDLYDQIEGAGHELVLFDVNRAAYTDILFRSHPDDSLRELRNRDSLSYRLTVITNRDPEDAAVHELTWGAGEKTATTNALPWRWPPQYYSLAHGAVPFPLDDPVYGTNTTPVAGYRIALGALELRGEGALLRVSPTALMRLRHNPFFGYIEGRLREIARADRPGAAAHSDRP